MRARQHAADLLADLLDGNRVVSRLPRLRVDTAWVAGWVLVRRRQVQARRDEAQGWSRLGGEWAGQVEWETARCDRRLARLDVMARLAGVDVRGVAA